MPYVRYRANIKTLCNECESLRNTKRRFDTSIRNYNDAQGSGVDRYFLMEEEPSEGRLKYLDQDYEVRVRDNNGQWSEWTTGTVIRV